MKDFWSQALKKYIIWVGMDKKYFDYLSPKKKIPNQTGTFLSPWKTNVCYSKSQSSQFRSVDYVFAMTNIPITCSYQVIDWVGLIDNCRPVTDTDCATRLADCLVAGWPTIYPLTVRYSKVSFSTPYLKKRN